MPVTYPSISSLVRTLPIIPPSVMRVYFAICKLADDGSPITVRGIGCLAGMASPNGVANCLKRLLAEGMISQEKKIGQNGKGANATIRPLFRVEMIPTGKITSSFSEASKALPERPQPDVPVRPAESRGPSSSSPSGPSR